MQEPSFVCAETLNQLLVGQSCRGPALWPRSGISGWGRAVCVPEKAARASRQGQHWPLEGRRAGCQLSPALLCVCFLGERDARPGQGQVWILPTMWPTIWHDSRLLTPCIVLSAAFLLLTSFLFSSLLFFSFFLFLEKSLSILS